MCGGPGSSSAKQGCLLGACPGDRADGGNKLFISSFCHIFSFHSDPRNCHVIYYWRFSIESGAKWVQGRRAGLLCTLIITSISPRSYHTVIPLPAPIKTIKVASVMKTNGHLVKVKIITAPSSVITANCSIVNTGLVGLHYHRNNHKTSQIWRLLRPYVATKLYSASQDWRVPATDTLRIRFKLFKLHLFAFFPTISFPVAEFPKSSPGIVWQKTSEPQLECCE